MNPFLAQTSFASAGLFRLLNEKRDALNGKLASAQNMESAARELFEDMKEQGRFSAEGIIDLAGFEEAKKRFSNEAIGIASELAGLTDALSALAGALLQIAKQGISIVHGGLTRCPPGRKIGSSEMLANVVWQARNQSMHYEEGNYSSAVRNCFARLESDFGSQFRLGASNLSLQVVNVLDWKDQASYERDMVSLLP